MRTSWLIAVLFVSISAHAQALRVIPVSLINDPLPKGIQFFCAENYDRQECQQHVAMLDRMLARYPIELIGNWSFVVATSNQWKAMVRSFGGNADSPAFSILERRTTVFEEGLFSATAERRAELLRLYGLSGDALFELAVSHELGHALCTDAKENHADEYGRQLRAGKIPVCDLNKPRAGVSAKSQFR